MPPVCGPSRLSSRSSSFVALATTMTVPVVGALLIFSLMIGPPAAARCVTDRPGVALGGSVVIALVTIWTSIAAAYATDWPVGFFVGVLSAGWFGVGRAYAAVSIRKRAKVGTRGTSDSEEARRF